MRKAVMALAALIAVSATPLAAQEKAAKATPLREQAKVSEAAARATALAKVPGGKITEAELEKEDGKLIWSFDVKVAGKKGIEEVHVDAMTGEVLKQEHETPKDEAAEAAADKAKAKTKKKP